MRILSLADTHFGYVMEELLQLDPKPLIKCLKFLVIFLNMLESHSLEEHDKSSGIENFNFNIFFSSLLHTFYCQNV